MKIGRAADATGLSVKAIRHYEAIGLLAPAARSGSYRQYGQADLAVLRSIARCRALGFNLAETREVLALVRESRPTCPPAGAMDALVERRLRATQREIRRLRRIEEELARTRRYLAEHAAG